MTGPEIRRHVRPYAIRTALTFLVGAIAGVVATVELKPPTRHVPIQTFVDSLADEADHARDAELRGLVAPVLYDVADRLTEVECPVAPLTNARIAAYVDSVKRRAY